MSCDVSAVHEQLTQHIHDNWETYSCVTPGIAWATFNSDQVLCDAFGYSRVEEEKLTTDHKFNIASSGKSIMCSAITDLAPNLWSKTVYDVWAAHPYVHPEWKSVEVQSLADMRGGLNDDAVCAETGLKYKEFLAATQTTGDTFPEVRRTFVNWLLSKAPQIKECTTECGVLGRDFSYSNFGYGVLGAMLEAETGTPDIDQILTDYLTGLDSELGNCHFHRMNAATGTGMDSSDAMGHEWYITEGHDSVKTSEHPPGVLSRRALPAGYTHSSAVEHPAGDLYMAPRTAAKYCQHWLRKLRSTLDEPLNGAMSSEEELGPAISHSDMTRVMNHPDLGITPRDLALGQHSKADGLCLSTGLGAEGHLESTAAVYSRGWLVEKISVMCEGKVQTFTSASHPGSFDGHKGDFVILVEMNIGVVIETNVSMDRHVEVNHPLKPVVDAFMRIATGCGKRNQSC